MATTGRVLSLSVPGMTCRHRVRAVTAQLRDVVGVQTVEADASHERVRVSGTMSAADLVGALDASGFPAAVEEPHASDVDGGSTGA